MQASINGVDPYWFLAFMSREGCPRRVLIKSWSPLRQAVCRQVSCLLEGWLQLMLRVGWDCRRWRMDTSSSSLMAVQRASSVIRGGKERGRRRKEKGFFLLSFPFFFFFTSPSPSLLSFLPFFSSCLLFLFFHSSFFLYIPCLFNLYYYSYTHPSRQQPCPVDVSSPQRLLAP